METYINLDTNSAYITASVRTKRRWLSKFTLRDKVSCISAFVVLLLVVFKSHDGECSRLNGAFASPCYMLDGNNKPILEKPQKCNPPFENVVAEKMVSVSPENMTCGMKGPSDYCIQTHGIYREC